MADFKREYNAETGVLSITGEGFTPLTIAINELSDEVKLQGLVFGIGTKAANGGALAKGSTPQERYEGMAKVIEALKAGSWNVGRTPGEAKEDTEKDLLIRAVVEVVGLPQEEAEGFVNNAKPADRNALKRTKEIAEAMARLRPASPASGQSILDQLRAKVAEAQASGEPTDGGASEVVNTDAPAEKASRRAKRGE